MSGIELSRSFAIFLTWNEEGAVLKVEAQAGCGIHRTCFLPIVRIKNCFYRKDS